MKIAIFLLILLCIIRTNISCTGDVTSPHREVAIEITEHILAGYFVTSIAFDSKNTAWIGTFKQGLLKYDGTLIIYNSSNSSFPDSVVTRDIKIDNNNHVWIGTDAGLIKFDGNDFHIYNTNNSPIAEDIVWSIAIDHENVMWIASCRFMQGGLMRFDGEHWALFTPENSPLPYNLVRSIAIDSKNNVWLAMSDGLIIKVATDNWKVYDANEIGFEPYGFGDLTICKDDKIYVSLDYRLSSYHDLTRPNLIVHNGRTWKINNPVDKNGESLGYVDKISTDLNGNVWASLHGRKDVILAVYDGHKWIYNDPGFPIESIFEISVDRSNTVWVGTGDGIFIIRQ